MNREAKTRIVYVGKKVTANTNILEPEPIPELAPSIYRIQVCADTAGVLSAIINGQVLQLNSANALTANALYIFDTVVPKNSSFNLQYSVDATMKILSIVEIPAERA